MEKLGQSATNGVSRRLSPSVPKTKSVGLPSLLVPNPVPVRQLDPPAPTPTRDVRLPTGSAVPQSTPTKSFAESVRPALRAVDVRPNESKPVLREVPQLPAHEVRFGSVPTLPAGVAPNTTPIRTLPDHRPPIGGQANRPQLPQVAPPPAGNSHLSGLPHQSAPHPGRPHHNRLQSPETQPPVIQRVTTFYDL